MLKRIYIHNYRTFVNFEWRPPAVCVLVGPNGAGKSALLEVLCLLQDLVVEGKRLDEVGFPSTLTTWRAEAAQTIEIDVSLDGDEFRYRLTLHKESSVQISEELIANGRLLYKVGAEGIQIFSDRTEPASSPVLTIPAAFQTSFLSAFETFNFPKLRRFQEYLGSFCHLKPDPLRLGDVATGEDARLARDLTNFASWYRARVQEDPDAVVTLRQDLERVLAGFQQLRLQPMPGGIKDLLVRFSFGSNTHDLQWRQLSEGQRLLIALYGAYRLSFPKAGLITLDEIENFVAPAEIQPWLREVVDLVAANDRQLIVVSHHSESINYLAADSIWHMWREHGDGHTRIAPLQPDREAGEAAYEATKAQAANA